MDLDEIVIENDSIILQRIYTLDNDNLLKCDELFNCCQMCLKFNDSNVFRDMKKTYGYQGKAEVYMNMLDYCFSLELLKSNENGLEYAYLICDLCIKRLRQVSNFKRQMEMAQEIIKKRINERAVAEYDCIKLDSNLESIDSNQSEREDDDFVLLLVDRESHVPDASMLGDSPVGPMNEETIDKYTETTSTEAAEDSENNNGTVKRDSTKIDNCKGSKQKIVYKYPLFPYELDKAQLQCKICKTTFDTHRHLQIHMPQHYPNFTCEICGRVFATLRQITKHALTHSDKVHKCPDCPELTFNSYEYKMEHIRRKHTDNNLLYRCPQCGERFSNYEQRQKHLIAAHDIKEEVLKYKCRQCDKSFVSSSSRSSHVRKVHQNELNCICAVCGKKFFRRTFLEQHMLKHGGVKDFACPQCKKNFQRKSSLTQHMKIHNGGDYICDHCGKVFAQKFSFKKHLAVHDQEEKKDET